MPTEINFTPLSPDKIKELTDAIEIAYQLVSVTLINGDVLIGALEKHWRWDGQAVSLGFNDAEGKRFGYSHIC